MLSLLIAPLLGNLLGCQAPPPPGGVYRSGPNAVARGVASGPIRVWGLAGTVTRVGSAGPAGSVLLGESGPLWVVDRDVPAPVKALPVVATTVESAGYRMKALLLPDNADTTAVTATAVTAPSSGAAKSHGVYVRSVVKVRRAHAPPVFVVTATGDDNGAGRFDGPPDKRAGANCKAAVGLMDSKGDTLLSGLRLDGATRTCSVPVVVPPVDRDGDGVDDVLIYGQNGDKGFRAWFRMDGERLVPGPSDIWEGIP